MLNSSIRDIAFDPIAFEQERDQIFARTEEDWSSQKYSRYSADYSDGEFDGKLGFEPSIERWGSSADYKQGYLSGIEEKYNDRFNQLI